VTDRTRLRGWLLRNHASSKGVWAVRVKQSAGGALGWNDLVEEALCFGWVDSLPRTIDERKTALLLTPRKPKSKWSAKNKAHVADLEARGLMHASGAAVVALAKKNGTWSALDAVSRLEVPADLAEGLHARSPARTNWDAFPPSTRRGILEWIEAAKRPETRAKRVEETATLAQKNVRALQWPPPKRA
jgi:uncharacterized protein YdeI (YjbR/CyaY-like superfamily)